MDYQDCLELAGAIVKCFTRFGSYQGDWFAKVVIDGQGQWVRGSYGSCSYCDQLESLMSEYSHDHEQKEGEDWPDHIWNIESESFDPLTCSKCKEMLDALKRVGEDYLDDLHTFEEMIEKASEDLKWDNGADEMVKWLEEHKDD